MNPREQTLATVLVGLIVLGAGTALGYFFLYQPYEAALAAETNIGTEIDDLTRKAGELRKNAQKLAAARTHSLPADEALSRREYTIALGRMIAASGVKDYTVSPKQVDNSARSVPQLAKDKPLYTRVAYELVLKKIDMWALDDFLKAYYEFGLLHQITALTIKKEDEPGAKVQRRNDLTVTITTEALIVDGAENRRTLLPIPTGVAAVGGGLLQKAVGTRSEAGRAFSTVGTPPEYNPERASGLVVLKDPFNGPLPPPPPFKIAKLDDLKLKPDEKPKPVKVALSGDGATGAKVTATVAGKLFPEAPLKVDPKTNAIELPTPTMTEENAKATATVSVVATSAEGKTEKTSFKISMVEPPKDIEEPPPAKPTEDISKVILLIAVVQGSDGTAWARVTDNANRTRYEVNVAGGEITVKKEYVLSAKAGWRDDDHKAPPGTMHISDEFSATNRLLKVVAVDGTSLIVADLQPGGAPKPPAKPPTPGKGRPGFGAPPVVRQGPGSPQAAVGGNVVVAVPAPKYYRWLAGHSLASLKPLSDKEKAEVLERVAAGSVLVNTNP